MNASKLKRSDHAAEATAGGTTGSALRKREALRRQYRPDAVRILFVGEAPPASGRFFYQGDSGLYRAVRGTFLAAFPPIQEDEFLDTFRALGCYLVDLCGEPVDRMPGEMRRKICREGETRLARRIRTLRPAVIVTLVRSIQKSVKRAESTAGWCGLHVDVPYPGRWKRHRVEFQRKVTPVLLETLPQAPRQPAPKAKD